MTGPVHKSAWMQFAAFFMAGVMVGAFSAVQVAPRITTLVADDTTGGINQPDVLVPGATPINPDTATPTELPSGPSGVPVPTDTLAPPPAGVECAPGKNGGSTDVGVTGDRIKLATTNVQSGRGASFLGEVRFAMDAVKNKINRAGGICGRLLEITYVDDGWDAARGQNYIRNFIKSDVFAIPVGPSSEGLQAAIKSGDIDGAGIPVVGADGMVINQYQSPWVWPVAVATVSAARIMARNAYARGAREFSIVFDKDYKFGQEAALAYNNEVRNLTNADVKGFNEENRCRESFCGIEQGAPSYTTEVQQFEPGDFVAMFLEPGTALTWMSQAGAPKPSTVPQGIGAAQPMFTKAFADNCQTACHGMWVWTGYRPPIDPYSSDPAVREYVSDLKKTKPNADENNAFTEGGYIGMQMLVEALKRVGPVLTRARLAAELDRMTMKTGLTIEDKMTWKPGNHFANTTMRAFEIRYRGTFGGWTAQDIVRDKTPTRGID